MTTGYERSTEQGRYRRDETVEETVTLRRTLKEWIERDSVKFESLYSEKFQNPKLSREYLLTYFGDVVVELYKRTDETRPAELSYDGYNHILQPTLLCTAIWAKKDDLLLGFNYNNVSGTNRVFEEGLVHLILKKEDKGAILKIRAKQVPPCA